MHGHRVVYNDVDVEHAYAGLPVRILLSQQKRVASGHMPARLRQ